MASNSQIGGQQQNHQESTAVSLHKIIIFISVKDSAVSLY